MPLTDRDECISGKNYSRFFLLKEILLRVPDISWSKCNTAQLDKNQKQLQ